MGGRLRFRFDKTEQLVVDFHRRVLFLFMVRVLRLKISPKKLRHSQINIHIHVPLRLHRIDFLFLPMGDRHLS